ncbi:MAG TPA: CopG family transcriptional regulator [Chloroflexota bacterium]|nr:CopG family transcriptional regulator [Chloroflexota bacterium]
MRTTVILPDDVAKILKLEAERLGTSPSQVIREAIATYLKAGPPKRRVPSFVGLADGPEPHDAATHDEELLRGMVENMAERNGLARRDR